MPVSNATTHFGFDHLSGSDIAGYNGINDLITSIDTRLNTMAIVPGMIMPFHGGAAPEGWTDVSATLTALSPAFPTLPFGYIWIKKD